MSKSQHTPGPWIIRPDYGQENVYRLWDKDNNFHNDSGDTDVMDANSHLMEATPSMLGALYKIANLNRIATANDADRNLALCGKIAKDAIAKATGQSSRAVDEFNKLEEDKMKGRNDL